MGKEKESVVNQFLSKHYRLIMGGLYAAVVIALAISFVQGSLHLTDETFAAVDQLRQTEGGDAFISNIGKLSVLFILLGYGLMKILLGVFEWGDKRNQRQSLDV